MGTGTFRCSCVMDMQAISRRPRLSAEMWQNLADECDGAILLLAQQPESAIIGKLLIK